MKSKYDPEEFYGADLNLDFQEFKRAVQEATANLKKATAMQTRMRWQFNDPEWWEEFTKEMSEAEGWISSHC